MIACLRTLPFIVSLTLTASCGGGGGTLASGGIGGTGISTGSVTAFGSIFVNGVEFDTSSALFTRDGEAATESQFSVGEVVTVIATFNADGRTGVAERVIYDAAVKGSTTDLSTVGTDRIQVLGQTVVITPATVLENFSTLEELAPGNILEVSGFYNSNGDVTATHISREQVTFVPGISVSQIRGVLANLDEVSMTFTIDDLTINFAAPQLIQGTLANGRFVEVESGADIVNGVLSADVVRVVSPLSGAKAGDELEMEGVVTRFASPVDFDVGSQHVTTTASTEFENGTLGDLGVGVQLEVGGQVDGDGVLVAEDVIFRLPENTFQLEGLVSIVNMEAGTVTVQDEVAGPVQVAVDSRTRFEDDSVLELQPFGLANIAIGDALEVTAFRRGDIVTAIRIEREESLGPGPVPPPPPDPDPVPPPAPDPDPIPPPDPDPDPPPAPDPDPVPPPVPDPVPPPAPEPDPDDDDEGDDGGGDDENDGEDDGDDGGND